MAQRTITLPPAERGFHLINRQIEQALSEMHVRGEGILHIHILHTSAALTLNENASRDVLHDFAEWFDRSVPDGASYFRHVDEGPDDMSAHIKSSLLGSSVTVPIKDGRLVLGTWQGVYLCEFRNRARGRSIVLTTLTA